MQTDSYAEVIIHVGTNDCATKFPCDKIISNVCDIIAEAKHVSISEKVIFSRLCPRFDNQNALDKVRPVRER